VAGIRHRCRAHNQYEAERTFGAEFMAHKRHAEAEVRRRQGGVRGSRIETSSPGSGSSISGR